MPAARVLNRWPLALLAFGCAPAPPKFPEIEPEARHWERGCTQGKAEACFELGRYLEDGAHAGASHEQAMAVLELGCSQGSARACGLLGTLYWQHYDQRQPSERAWQLLESSCSRNIPESCFVLAQMRLKSEDSDSGEAAASLFMRACRMGVRESCAWAGRVFLNGHGLAVDRERGKYWLWVGCTQGSAASCDEWATALEDLGMASMAHRLELKWHACRMGWASSCAWLSGHYVDPQHTRYDCVEAMRPAQMACSARAADACGTIAICRDLARPHPQVPNENTALYRACNQGSPSACYYLAEKLSSGGATEDEVGEARRLYAHACHRGDAMSCNAALRMPSVRTTEGASRVELLGELEKQCSARKVEACTLLAKHYQGDEHGLRDLQRAHELRQIACQLGDAVSCDQQPVGR